MTNPNKDTPAVGLGGGPLTAEMVPLLTPGASVLRSTGHLWLVIPSAPDRLKDILHLRNLARGYECSSSRFGMEYIGERSSDGWITAPSGGWAENPVPGRMVACRAHGGFGPRNGQRLASESVVWPRVADFRLTEAEAALPDASQPGTKSEGRSAPNIPAEGGEAVGAAEKEVGRAVYERIESLMNLNPKPSTSECAELDYLSHLAESVEEVGGYGGPLAALSATPTRPDTPAAPVTEPNHALREACHRMADDYQTSETHHPDHVLVRKDYFDVMVSLLSATPTPQGASVVVPREAVQRLILAADSYGVRFLDSDDMSDEAEELQSATEAMKDLIAAASTPSEGAVVGELVAALRNSNNALQRLHTDVEALMADSEGVYGLHGNGDPAPWDELREGGRFDDWIGAPLLAARNAWHDGQAALSRTEAATVRPTGGA